MTSLDTTVDALDWASITTHLDAEGYAMMPGLLSAEAARGLAQQARAVKTVRVPLATGDLGRGELLYFAEGLPALLETWRAALYRHLVAIANHWNEALGVDSRYPAQLDAFLQRNRKAGQTRAQSYLCRLGVEDYVSLHRRNDSEQVFPMQIVALLSEPGSTLMGVNWS